MDPNEQKWDELMEKDKKLQKKRIRAEKAETANNVVGGVTFIVMIVGIIIAAAIAAVVFGIKIF